MLLYEHYMALNLGKSGFSYCFSLGKIFRQKAAKQAVLGPKTAGFGGRTKCAQKCLTMVDIGDFNKIYWFLAIFIDLEGLWSAGSKKWKKSSFLASAGVLVGFCEKRSKKHKFTLEKCIKWGLSKSIALDFRSISCDLMKNPPPIWWPPKSIKFA